MKTNNKLLISLCSVLSLLIVFLVVFFHDYGHDMNEDSISSQAAAKDTDINTALSEGVELEGNSNQPHEIVKPIGTTGSQRSLYDPDALRGIVIRRDGSPCANAEVTIVQMQDLRFQLHPTQYQSFQSKSGRDGRFYFNSIPRGRYGIMAVKGREAGYMETPAVSFVQQGCGNKEYEVVLRAMGNISGQVLGEGGSPVTKARVIPFDMVAAQRRTDASGNFNLSHLAIGKYKLVVFADGYAPRFVESVTTGTTDLRIRLARGGGISGTVICDGAPVSGIGVWACRSSSYRVGRLTDFPYEARSNSEGRFELKHLREDEYSLHVMSKSHYANVIYDLSIAEGETLTGIHINLKEKSGSISGRVTEIASGNPLAGIQVQAYSMLHYSMFVDQIAVTDDDGMYSFSSLSHGSNPIGIVGSEQFAADHKLLVDVKKDGCTQGVDFQLTKAASFDLVLRDENGDPVSNVGINRSWISPDNPGVYLGMPLFPDYFESEPGRYKFQGLCPGQYNLEIEKRGLERLEHQVLLEKKGEFKTDELVLKPTHSITGKVQDPGGSGIAGAIVESWREDKSITDEQGYFKLYGLVSGTEKRNNIKISAPGYLDLKKRVYLDDDKDEMLEITLTPLYSHFIAGRVVNDLNEPLSDLLIVATQTPESTRQQRTAITDSEGRFRIEQLCDFPVKLDIPPNRGHVREPEKKYYEKVPVDEPNLEIIIDRFGEVMGRVVDPSGNPAYANVHAWARRAKSRANAVTQPDGTFHLQRVPPGEVYVNIKSDGIGYVNAGPLTIEPGSILRDVELTLNVYGVIKGHVLDAETREPVSGARVYQGADLRPSRWHLDNEWTKVRSTNDGSFTIDDIKPGIVDIAVMHRDYAVDHHSNIAVTGGSVIEGIEFLMSRGCEIEGHVYANGKGVPSAEVDISGPGHEYQDYRADSNGFYRCSQLIPGAYSVTVSVEHSGGVQRLTKTINIKNGEVKRCDFEITPGSVAEGKITLHGVPVPDVSVDVYPLTRNSQSDNSSSGWTSTDSSGNFRIEGLETGTYFLRARQTKEKIVRIKKEVEIVEGVNFIDLKLDEVGFGNVEGTITINGSPAKDALIQLLIDNHSTRVRADEQGRFNYKDVQSGTIELVVIHRGKDTNLLMLRRKWELEAGDSLNVEIDLPVGAATLTGKVTCNNHPVNETRIYAYPEALDGFSIMAVTRQGEYTLKGLNPGKYRIWLRDTWEMEKFVEVGSTGTHTVNFEYSKGKAMLTGTLEAPSNWTEDGLSAIHLFEPGKCPWKIDGSTEGTGVEQGLVLTKRVWGGGAFTINDLSAGAYDAVATLTRDDQILNMKSVSIILSDKESTEVHFSLLSQHD